MILGTVQFGLNYGVSNTKGQPDKFQVSDILEIAHFTGVRRLDTASAYGNAEKIVGELNGNRFEIISKLPDLSRGDYCEDYRDVSNFLHGTLECTQQKQLNAYLLHSADNLMINGKFLWRKMQEFKELGFTKKIGYSLYSPKQLDKYFVEYKPDIVQIPMSILDREFQKTGWLKRLKDNGVEVHVRSVFLQGLLLMQFEEQVFKFPRYKSTWDLFKKELKDLEISALDYCLGFVKGVEEIDEIVIGANSAEELIEIMESDVKFNSVPLELSSSDEKLIYPFNWE